MPDTEGFDCRRRPDESDKQYIWRICSAKDAGIITLNWTDVAAIINKELFDDETKWLHESVFRKEFRVAKRYQQEVFTSGAEGTGFAQSLEDQRLEIEKAKQQLADQRREFRKDLRYEARAEHLHNIIREAAERLPALITPLPRLDVDEKRECGGAAVLFLNDWHYGMITDNIWNKYNTDICIQRVANLADRVVRYLRLHRKEQLIIVLLGDMCAGAIHVGTRVEAEETVCEQLMEASELLARFIDTVSAEVAHVSIYSTYGNHMRTVQNRHESVHHDNMERIIPWWLKERLKSSHVKVIEQDSFGELIYFNVGKYGIVASHGDLDNIRSMGPTMSALFHQQFGVDVDYVVMGDKHHAEGLDTLGITSRIVPALCGTDGYAHGKRLYSKPGQTMMMFDLDYGLECEYTITF